jgi:hypothetical protein
MAYESDQTVVTSALKTSSTEVFTDAVISQILALSNANGGTMTVTQLTADPAPATLDLSTTTSGLVFLSANAAPTGTDTVVGGEGATIVLGGTAGANVTFAPKQASAGGVVQGASGGVADAGVERIVVHSAQADKITVADGINTEIIVGDKDTVVAGNGYDTVVAAQGDSTVTGGTAGHTILKAAGAVADYTVTEASGTVKIHSAVTGVDVTVDNIQYVQLDNNKALVFANNATEASIATLYHGIFGRTGDAYGLEFYFNAVDRGANLKSIADAMLKSAEYTAAHTTAVTNDAFLASLYTNILGRTGDAAGLKYYGDLLTAGTSRADVAAAFADIAGKQLATGTGTETKIVAGISVIEGII